MKEIQLKDMELAKQLENMEKDEEIAKELQGILTSRKYKKIPENKK